MRNTCILSMDFRRIRQICQRAVPLTPDALTQQKPAGKEGMIPEVLTADGHKCRCLNLDKVKEGGIVK